MEHPKTAVVVSSLVIERGGKVLFLEEKREEGVRLNLPGGHLHGGESPEEAALREGKEETGFNLEITSCVGALINTWNKAHSIRIIYRAEIIDGEPTPEEGTVFHWLSIDDYKSLGVESINGLEEMLELVRRGSEQRFILLDYRNK